MDELALTRWPGGSDVVAEQLDHLFADVTEKRVDLRIIPLARDLTTFAMGAFIVYDFSAGASVVMTEGQTADVYMSADPDVAAYRKLFRDLQHQALDADASRAHIENLRAQLVP